MGLRVTNSSLAVRSKYISPAGASIALESFYLRVQSSYLPVESFVIRVSGKGLFCQGTAFAAGRKTVAD